MLGWPGDTTKHNCSQLGAGFSRGRGTAGVNQSGDSRNVVTGGLCNLDSSPSHLLTFCVTLGKPPLHPAFLLWR